MIKGNCIAVKEVARRKIKKKSKEEPSIRPCRHICACTHNFVYELLNRLRHQVNLICILNDHHDSGKGDRKNVCV